MYPHARAVTAPVPYAPTLELELAGALAGWKHHGRTPNPADFYHPTTRVVAEAFTGRHRDRIHYFELAHLSRGDDVVFAYTYTGLIEALTDLGEVAAERVAVLAGVWAARAPVTTNADVDELERLSNNRARLAELDTERQALLAP